MKVVFLDIDGVLNSVRSTFARIGPVCDDLPMAAAYALRCVDPICVALVNQLIAEAGAALVLSSSHRRYFADDCQYGSSEHLQQLREYLTQMGIKVPAKFDITDSLRVPRGEEVQAWVKKHGEPERYVILDDAATDFMGYQPLVPCNPEFGFDFTDYMAACKHLGCKPPGMILI